MKSIAIIYGSSTDNTKDAAAKIAAGLSAYNVDVKDVCDVSEEDFQNRDLLILGTSTWGIGELQDDWGGFFNKFEKMDLSGKTIALFGLGDSSGYPDSFVDGMGILYEVASKKGCRIIGEVSTDGYTFDDSKALQNGVFVGLPLDEDNESDMTSERIAQWTESLKNQLG